MKIAIIDDEINCRNLVEYQLKKISSVTPIIKQANGVDTGISLIRSFQPEIVFLDIQMNDGTGFDLLKQINHLNFKTIFTTAFDNYAIEAFKFSAVHYLLKPICPDEFKIAFERAEIDVNLDQERLSNLMTALKDSSQRRLKISTENDFHIIDIENIKFLSASGSYCTFNLNNHKKILVSKPLGEYENILLDHGFVRVHRSYLVNLNCVQLFNYKSSQVILKSGEKITISRRNKQSFLNIVLNRSSIAIQKLA